MDGFMALVAVFIFGGAAIGIACLIWRGYMAVCKPEAYRRFREWEEEETARQKKIVSDAAKVVAPVVGAVVKRIVK